jgi:hypothetical protein
MKVFMSWSGARSKAAAELLHDWVKCVIQASRPWISTRGIGRGAVWFTEINNELKDTSVGIICLTHQNKNAPWILFEAGALAKGLATNKVCTFLVDLGTTDIQDPLAQFNHTLPTREGMMGLAVTLNSSLEHPLDGRTLEAVFDAFWPQFDIDFKALLEHHKQEAVVEARSETSMLEEILESTRGLSQRMRVIESRQVNNEAEIVPSAWGGSSNKLAEFLSVKETKTTLSITEARNILSHWADSGVSRFDARQRLTDLAGSRRAQILWRELAGAIFPPSTGAVDKSS